MKFKDLLRKMRKDPAFMIGFCGICIISLVCLLAPLYCVHDPAASDLTMRNAAPEWFANGWSGHILGCDMLGRDVLTRMLYGGRVSLFIAVAVVACTVVLGATVGLIAGYYGGMIDMLLCRIGDVFQSIPSMLLAVCIIAVLGSNFFNLIFTMTITSWVVAARMVRGQVLTCKNSDYIRAEVVMGAKGPRILFNQILPNTLTPLIIQETQHFGGVIMSESGMSFLGLGIPYPTPSWGTMISDGRAYLTSAPWVVMAPGIMLMITVLCFNFFGDGIRDVLDPKNKD